MRNPVLLNTRLVCFHAEHRSRPLIVVTPVTVAVSSIVLNGATGLVVTCCVASLNSG
jgi:hypothetical protein